MIELIKELVNEGFEVMVVKVMPKFKETHMILPPAMHIEVGEMIKGGSGKVFAKKGPKPKQKNPNNNPKSLLTEDMAEVEKKKSTLQRINWKTINKIKEAKEDGLSSAECAKDLGLPLAVVNKYWI